MLESDLHDKLMLAFRDYFTANEKWETNTSDQAGIRARNALGIIRILARQRRMEIQRHRKMRKELRNNRKEDSNE